MTSEELIRCINHWRQYGEIEWRFVDMAEASWSLVTASSIKEKQGWDEMKWDLKQHEYRIPKREDKDSPRGDIVWDRMSQSYMFQKHPRGRYVRWEDYERDCNK